ncbi:hypothetical protein [Maribacter dokdonensis]|uniref:hypothetical protein n=1 Tax=Maribacter dokdonensis TaxID=320912 RepID=UPI001C08FD3E|nr:hypothetical protein [Maribacter dokdonensis]MBU2900841.1 hypothetical protein [Maribacter dokdonensis]
MKGFIISCLLLYSFAVNAQKKVYKSVLDDHIELIQVDATNCFIVEVETSNDNQITVQTEIEGEYSQYLEIEVFTNGNTLLIDTGFTPNFKNPNDKLSAHKVISIAIKIIMPIQKKLEVFGTNARVVVEGTYKEVNISLSDGACFLNNVLGSTKVKTQSGNISVVAKAADITTVSKYGDVSRNPIPFGTSSFLLETITGNILLSKTE